MNGNPTHKRALDIRFEHLMLVGSLFITAIWIAISEPMGADAILSLALVWLMTGVLWGRYLYA